MALLDAVVVHRHQRNFHPQPSLAARGARTQHRQAQYCAAMVMPMMALSHGVFSRRISSCTPHHEEVGGAAISRCTGRPAWLMRDDQTPGAASGWTPRSGESRERPPASAQRSSVITHTRRASQRHTTRICTPSPCTGTVLGCAVRRSAQSRANPRCNTGTCGWHGSRMWGCRGCDRLPACGVRAAFTCSCRLAAPASAAQTKRTTGKTPRRSKLQAGAHPGSGLENIQPQRCALDSLPGADGQAPDRETAQLLSYWFRTSARASRGLS